MIGRVLSLALLACSSALMAGAIPDEGSEFVAEALGRRVVGPDVGLAEVRLHVEGKVPRMPVVRDVAAWEREATRMRAGVLRDVVYRGEAARWRELPTRVEWQETIDGGPGYRIKKLRYEAVPGLWVPALLYEPTATVGRVPAVLNFDGHDPKGMFADYKQVRCINLAKRGMIALDVDWIGMGQLRSTENQHVMMNHLDLCGTSGLSVFYSLQTRGVDVLLSLANVDPARVGVTGLSGGGWQTIFLGAMDTRVSVVVPVAGYSSFLTRTRHNPDLGDAEQTPVDLGTITDYAPMTAMLAPRAALLTFNAKDDCCFAADHALPPLLDAASPIYRLYGRETQLKTHVNTDPGTHNYLKDNREALYRVLGEQFFPGRADYPAEEIPSDAEVKTIDQLKVALPADQATMHSIALALSRNLPRDPTLPAGQPAALAWQADRRKKLAEIVRVHAEPVRAEEVGRGSKGGVSAVYWKLHIGESWTVPAVDLSRDGTDMAKPSTIVLVDLGRKEAKALVEGLLTSGRRVLAVDPFDVGESKISERVYLWHLLVSTVGDRPVGLQASEVASIARWLGTRGTGPCPIVADGPRSSTMALVAAGLEPSAIGDLELRGAPATLKEPIEAMTPFSQSPDRFCFGLLEWFDVPQLVALAAPRKVAIVAPGDRAKAELAPLKAWYAGFGVEFNPVP